MRVTTLIWFFVTASLSADTVATHSFRSKLSAAGVERVVIEIPAAEITITNGPAHDVELIGTAEREYHSSRDLERSQRIANASSVRMEMKGRSLVVSRVLGAGADKRSWSELTMFRLQLTVPEGMPIELDQRFGEVEMTGVFGDTTIEMKAGEVRINTPRRGIKELSARAHIGEVSTNLGRKVITKEGIFAGSTHYFNERGHSSLVVNLAVGEINIVLTD